MFFCGSLLGPVVEYKDFVKFINKQDCYAKLVKGTTVVPALLKFLQGIAFVVISLTFEIYYDPEHVKT